MWENGGHGGREDLERREEWSRLEGCHNEMGMREG